MSDLEVVERSAVLLQDINDPDSLEELFEQVLNRADGEDWLWVLRPLASTRCLAAETDADAGKSG